MQLTSWLPFLEPLMRIEEFRDDDQYVVRAEIPGVDPAKDVSVTAENGVLRLGAVRMAEESKVDGHSEFRFGTFHREITLPLGVKPDTIAASYTNGILEITMTVGEPKANGHTIPVEIKPGSRKALTKS